MATIDAQWLEEHNVKAEPSEIEELLAVVNTEWEMRVGYAIAELLTEEQIDEIEQINNEDEQVEWLAKVYPQYPDTVSKISDKISADIIAAPDKVALIKEWKKQQNSL